MTDTRNPNFAIRVGNTELEAGLKQLVERVEYESCDGMADVFKMTAINPNFSISDLRILLPGNEISVYMGYGGELGYIGRAVIYKHRPHFPRDGMPTIEIIGYSKSHEMMHNSPPQAAPAGRTGGRRRGGRRQQQSQSGRRFRNMKYSDAVAQHAFDYSFDIDVDESPEAPTDFIQKSGMSDYDFVQGLANLSGFLFWVDADENGRWTLHFKDPERLDNQDIRYRFEYNLGDTSTLLSFDPEFLVTEAIAAIRVRVQDPITGQVFEAEFNEDNIGDAPEILFQDEEDQTLEVDRAPGSGTAVQLYIGDYSFEEIANRRFRSEADAIRWARQWYRRQRDNFINSRGMSIGVEPVRARQIHDISGVGMVYDGPYYFSRVRHMCTKDDGYTMDFNCRKQTTRGSGL
jgi:phage protein D